LPGSPALRKPAVHDIAAKARRQHTMETFY